MEIPKDKIIELIRDKVGGDKAEQAQGELPDKVDPERDGDLLSKYGINPQDIPNTFNGSLVYLIPGDGALTGGWRLGGIFNARSGVPKTQYRNRAK